MKFWCILGLAVALFTAHLILKPAPEKTVERLLEQASGDARYWDHKGNAHSIWQEMNVRQYNHHVKIYAIRELGEMGPAASGAVDRLVQLCSEQSDYNTFDGRLAFHLDVVRTLGLIGDPSAIDPLLAWYRIKATDPKSDLSATRRDTLWHNTKTFSYCGPSGFVEGLYWFPEKEHELIEKKLASLLAELEKVPDSSQWAKRALRDGIQILKMDPKEKFDSHIDYMKSQYDFSCRRYGIERDSFENSPYPSMYSHIYSHK